MLTASEKRAVLQALSRFALLPSRQHKAVRSTVDAYGGVDVADLLSHLVQQKLLSPGHVNKIRSALGEAEEDSLPPTVMSLDRAPAAASAPAPEPGVSCGEYRLLRKIGQGGMCSVFLGYSEKDGRQVAIKILPEALAEKISYLKRFYREAQSGALLDHPNIVRNLAFGKDPAGGGHYLILEYVDGPTAQGLLEQYERLSVGDAVHIILDIARGLEYAHSRNIIHRDIKPSNILLTKSGVAKLADMGLAKRTDEETHLTGTHQGFGTPYYMPYEQALNARSADARSDVYALGATLYHLLSGEVPFSGESHIEIVEKKGVGKFRPARALNRQIPEELDAVINKMMARNPESRFQSVGEVIVALERTQLAPAVPSFIDEKLATEDPVVRDRLTSSAQPTRPDLGADGVRPGAGGDAEIWYVRYRKAGEWRKVKATTAQIVKRVGDRKIPPNAQVRRPNQTAFQPLAEVEDFRPALAKLSRRKKRRAKISRNNSAAAPPSDSETVPPAASGWVLVTGGIVAICLIAAVLFVLVQILTAS